MLATLNHHLNAEKVEHDHLETISQDHESEHVPDFQLWAMAKPAHPRWMASLLVDISELHPPVATGVRPENDFARDGGHVLMEGIGDQK